MAACADAKPGGSGDGGPNGGNDASVPPGDAVVSGEVGDPCERASQCRGELICEPAEETCAEPFSCVEHGECGQGAHCADGVCSVSTGGSPCASNDDCAYLDECVGGYCGCRGEAVEAKLREVNLLVVLDRSASMWENPNGNDAPWEQTKWFIAMTAIDGLLEATTESVRFGLALFPHVDSRQCGGCDAAQACTPGHVLVDVGPGTEDEIRDQLEATMPDCCTPTGDTLSALIGHPSLSDPSADNYVLLIADGMETCGGSAPSAAEALRAQNPSVRTFAVGFGGAVDPEELRAIAEAGGTRRDGEPAYYQADNRDELERAFSDIAVEAFSCVHPVEGETLAPASLRVYADDEEVPRDPQRESGWDYDPDRNELSFHGPVCEALRRGAVDTLSYVQTCDIIID